MDIIKLKPIIPTHKASDKRHKPTQQEVKSFIDEYKKCIDKLDLKIYNKDS